MNALAIKKKYDNLSENAKYIALGSIAILGLAVWSYYKGKSNGSVKIDHIPLPKENGALSDTDKRFVRETVLKLHDSLKGFGSIFRDGKPFLSLANAPDKIFVAIYNDFNNMYKGEDQGTLRDWIKDDWYQDGTQTAGAVRAILGRMDVLNLR